MSAELIPLPNFKSKILRSTIKTPKELILVPVFQDFNFLKLLGKLETETFEILVLILSLYYQNRERDELLYFNTDDILILRSIKKSKMGKSGYKRKVRERIKEKVLTLSKLKFFTVVNYKDFNFVLSNDSLPQEPEFMPVKRKVFCLNLRKKSWHKRVFFLLNFLTFRKKKENFNLQIKKIFEILNPPDLKPNETRERFENTLDELCCGGIIKSWHYLKIDENALNCKNWLRVWKSLSVRISS